MDPELYSLGMQLADVAIRNTASSVGDKISAAKARKRDQETIGELEEVINNLIADKNELVRIAQAYEQELAAQRISQSDVEYITTNIVPIIKRLVVAGSSSGESSDVEETLDTVVPLLSVETINILQLLGFNFKRALGEPLTEVVARLISSKAPSDTTQGTEIQLLQLQREIAYISLAQDPEAFARLSSGSNANET